MKSNGKARSSVVGCRGLDRPTQTPPRTLPLAKRLFTATEAAHYLGFKTAWGIRGLAWQGALPIVRLGKRRIAFDIEDLDRFIEARKILECIH